MAAVFSVQVLNTATPIVVAIVGFGSVIWLLERRRSPNWTPVSAVYFAFISTSTFGYGDFSPASPIGRLLTSFWAIFTVLALTALTGVVSSELTVASLQYTTITELGQLTPDQLCIPHYYRTLHLFVSEAMNLPLTNNEFVGGGVVLSDEYSCMQMVLNGTVKAFMTDSSVLAFMAYGWNQDTNALFISPSVRANPMSWVFPSNSPYTTPLNRAIIESLVNNTWHGQKTALESIWFPAGSPQSVSASEPQVNVPMLTAALVLTGAWLLCLFSQSLWEVAWISRLLRRYLPQRLVGPPPPLAEGKKAVTPFHAPGSQGAALESSREAAAACKAAAASAIEAATKAELLAQELELSFLRAGSPTSARIETTL
jgi:Ion channel